MPSYKWWAYGLRLDENCVEFALDNIVPIEFHKVCVNLRWFVKLIMAERKIKSIYIIVAVTDICGVVVAHQQIETCLILDQRANALPESIELLNDLAFRVADGTWDMVNEVINDTILPLFVSNLCEELSERGELSGMRLAENFLDALVFDYFIEARTITH